MQELYSLMAGIEAVLRQTLREDGITDFDARWMESTSDVNNTFKSHLSHYSTDFYRHLGPEFYEALLMENHASLMDVNGTDLTFTYRISDTCQGKTLDARAIIWIKHPPEYREALEHAGSLHREMQEVLLVSCPI